MKKSVTLICIIISAAILIIFILTMRNLLYNRAAHNSQIEETFDTEETSTVNSTEGTETPEKDTKITEKESLYEKLTEATESSSLVENETTTEKSETEESTTEESNSDVKEESPFTTVSKNYFEDALFIGDSRTVGLRDYGNIEGATFFAGTGMSVYSVHKGKVSVAQMGRVSFEELLNSQQFGKIYIMLGINELGYPQKSTIKKYSELVNKVRQLQPEAIIFIQANLHVTIERTISDEIFNNDNINIFNSEIARLADGEGIFFIDANELFDDEQGNLGEEYASDNTHIQAKYYIDWRNWLQTKAIIK